MDLTPFPKDSKDTFVSIITCSQVGWPKKSIDLNTYVFMDDLV